MLTAIQRLLIIGILVNSALYNAGCIIAGLITESPYAWKLALVSVGICYLTYLAQLAEFPRRISNVLVILSIITGVGAGLALL